MSRRHTATIAKPDCPHRAAEWAEYHERLEARRALGYGGPEPWPSQPVNGHGYCEDCQRALYASADPWPADVWAYLNTIAASDYHTGTRAILKSKPSLPKYHGGRVESLPKLYARALATCQLKPGDEDYTRCESFTGANVGGGYGLVSTTGHTALVQKGKTKPGAKLMSLGLDRDAGFVDLPAEFHAALKRVRLFSSERSNAVKLSIGPWRLRLSAADGYGNEAAETVELAGPGTDVPELETTLNADYLDAVCGVWPLRWYLRPGAGNEAQSFQPAGADWRAVIMPMRV